MTFEEKLAESGISIDIADKYHLKEIKNMKEIEEYLPTASAIQIPYFNLAGERINFERYRILKQGSIFSKRFEGKYYQKKDTGVFAYFPPTIKWQDIKDDAGFDIIITEGEFKAIATAEAGYNCIGLGGVSSFQSIKSHEELIQGLSDIVWQDRTVYIIYDSDLVSNIQVVKAQQSLAQILYERGAKCWLGFIDEVVEGGGKVGLDDLIKEHGAESVLRVLGSAKPYRQFTQLQELSNKYIYSENQDMVLNIESDSYVTLSAFHNTYASRQVTMEVPTEDGELKKKRVSLTKEWMKSPLRPTVFDICFEPSTTDRIIKKEGLSFYNSFSGLAVKPEKNYKLSDRFLELIYFLCSDLKQSEIDFFIRWMATPFKSVGLRTNICTLVWSHMEGNGKSAVGEVLAGMYGKYSATITSADLLSPYNKWISGKLFIQSDELFGQDGDNIRDTRKNMDLLKNLITQTRATINGKYMKIREENVYCNYYFTSNNNTSIIANETSRRFFVIHAPESRLSGKFYYDFFKEVNSPAGYAAILYYFLNEVKTTQDIAVEAEELINAGKEEQAMELYNNELMPIAPETEALRELREAGLSNVAWWLKRMSECAEEQVEFENSGLSKKCIVPQVITVQDLVKAYNVVNERGGMTYSNMIKILKGHNYHILKRLIPTNNGTQCAVVLSNLKRWQKEKTEVISGYIKKWQSYMP